MIPWNASSGGTTNDRFESWLKSRLWFVPHSWHLALFSSGWRVDGGSSSSTSEAVGKLDIDSSVVSVVGTVFDNDIDNVEKLRKLTEMTEMRGMKMAMMMYETVGELSMMTMMMMNTHDEWDWATKLRPLLGPPSGTVCLTIWGTLPWVYLFSNKDWNRICLNNADVWYSLNWHLPPHPVNALAFFCEKHHF